MKKSRLIVSIATVAVAISTLVGFGVTYSWIQREFKPDLSGTEFMVQTSGTLAIKFDNDSTQYSEINLNDVVGQENVTLKQVSNSTGLSTDFFNIQYDAATGIPTLQHLNLTSEVTTYEQLATENGYVETKFLITCSSNVSDVSSKFIFLDNSADSCYIRFPENCGPVNNKDVTEAIRVSITAPDLGLHYLFRKTVYRRDSSGNIITGDVNSHRGAKTTNLNNTPIYDPNNPGQLNTAAYVETDNIHEFSDYDGGVVDGDDTNIDPTKVLFSMQQGFVWVTLRVWLEGYDPNTVDDISGEKINFKITFRMNSDPGNSSSSN